MNSFLNFVSIKFLKLHHWPSSPSSHRWHATTHALVSLSRSWVLDCFVHAQDETCGLRCSCDGVNFHNCRLPDTSGKIISDVLGHNVNSVPTVVL